MLVSCRAAPLYSTNGIPRYLLPAAMFTWLLLPLAVLRLRAAAAKLTRPGRMAK